MVAAGSPGSGNAYDVGMANKTLYIIDGHSQIFRAYYAPFGALASPTGEPTRATHVFCQMLLNLIRDRRPDYLVMVLDADESKLQRREIYPEYKANREPPPEDFGVQEQRIFSILAAVGVPMLRIERYEADDIIASLVTRMVDEALGVTIVSRDKDLDQLLRPGVTIYDPMKDQEITADTLESLKGWPPELAVEAQVLMGDSVDNVPGVPGIGPKTAAKLLKKYGSAASLIEHADQLTPKQRENVLAFAPHVERTRHLVTLLRDVPLDVFDLEACACEKFNWPAAQPIFAELGFRRLQEQLPGGGDVVAPTAPQVNETQDEHAELLTTLRDPAEGEYETVNTPEALDALVTQLTAADAFAFDTETTDLGPIDAELVGLAFSTAVGRGHYVPLMSMYGGELPSELVRAKLGPLLADESKLKVAQHVKYDLLVLRHAGFTVRGPLFDTMIAAFALDPTKLSYGLDKLVSDLFGHTMIPITDLIGKGRDQLRIDQVPLEHITEYAGEDADYTYRLYRAFQPQLATRGVDKLFYETEMPLVDVLTQMEFEGVSLDIDFLAQMNKRMVARLDELRTAIQQAAGVDFNPDSPKQLGDVLFEQLGFRKMKRTAKGGAASTDAETLAALARDPGESVLDERARAVPGLMLEYREMQKLRGTYVDALPKVRARRTGRIHTHYNQTGAITGRLSSSEPNLQNIPVRGELGREIRRAFVPRSANERLIVADYSQVELRVLAHFSEDEQLLAAFREDQDIHAFVAAQVNGVALDAVTSEMRARSKAVNFGIVYGQTAFGLAQTTGMSRSEAQQFINAYFARYPRIRAFIDQCIQTARDTGEVRTILGRRRPIWDITSRNPSARALGQRLAVNTVVQGSAADLIKVAMISLHRRIHDESLPLRLLLQVHDELVCEAPADQADAMAAIVRDVMTGAMHLHAPLKADAQIGRNWLEAK